MGIAGKIAGASAGLLMGGLLGVIAGGVFGHLYDRSKAMKMQTLDPENPIPKGEKMGVAGKILGGSIGLVLGGPLGAMAGGVFGHVYDKSKAMKTQMPDPNNPLPTIRARLTFFVATFSMLAKLAKSDGPVSRAQIESIEKFMDEELKFDHLSRKAAIGIFRKAARSDETFEGFAVQFYNEFRKHPRMLEFMIDILLRVAVADGMFSEHEEDLILSAVQIFHFNKSRYETLKSQYVKNSDRSYAVLGCTRDDSEDVIKKRYRKLLHDYHPDKIASKGLPDEFTRFANAKFQEIKDAYDAIMKNR